jgi:hypothetical protein
VSGATVRVVRGAPRAEELAALVLVLRALAAQDAARAAEAASPRAADWSRPAAPLTVPSLSWATRPPPAWRAA